MESEKNLKLIEQYAALLFSISEIAILIECNKDQLKQLIEDETTAEYKAYFNGKMKTILEIRKQEIDLAKLGSPVAIELMQKYINSQNIEEHE